MENKDKNILYIVHSYHSFQKDSIEALAKNFKNVYVIVRYKPFAELSNILPIKSLLIHRKRHVIQASDKPRNVKIFVAPLWYLPFPLIYRFLGDYHFLIVDWIIRKNKLKFDIIHSHFTWTSGYVGMKLKRKYKIPFVLTVHSSKRLEAQIASGDERYYSIWREADAIFRVNKKNIEDLKKYNEATYYMPNGFNQHLFFPREARKCRELLNIPLDKKVLLSVGHLVKNKGHLYLVKAVESLVNVYGYKNIVLYIIGEGGWRKKIEAEILRLQLQDYVKLIGSKLHKEIPLWMNSCDLFVFPSLVESFGIVQLEAFACGKPVVATQNEGSKEVITSQDIGLLCNIADTEDLAKTINFALKKNWSEREIIKYVQQYTVESVLKGISVTYQEVLTKYND